VSQEQEQEQGRGPVVSVKLMSQVEDGPFRELASYELTAPDQAPACTARILREVADEFEALGPGGFEAMDEGDADEEGR